MANKKVNFENVFVTAITKIIFFVTFTVTFIMEMISFLYKEYKKLEDRRNKDRLKKAKRKALRDIKNMEDIREIYKAVSAYEELHNKEMDKIRKYSSINRRKHAASRRSATV